MHNNNFKGCISLGAAYTYYEKKQKSKIVAAEEAKEPKHQEHKQDESHQEEAKKTSSKPNTNIKTPATKKNIDYQQVYNDIAELLDSDSE